MVFVADFNFEVNVKTQENVQKNLNYKNDWRQPVMLFHTVSTRGRYLARCLGYNSNFSFCGFFAQPTFVFVHLMDLTPWTLCQYHTCWKLIPESASCVKSVDVAMEMRNKPGQRFEEVCSILTSPSWSSDSEPSLSAL